MKAHVTLLPGDGIGPEVVASARTVLYAVARRFGHELVFEEHLIGGAAMVAHGTPLPAPTRECLTRTDAVLLGAVGGPQWDDPRAALRPEQGLLELRSALGVYANLRPVRSMRGLAHASPLRSDRIEGVDLLFVRELTGGLYFSEPRGRDEREGVRRGFDTLSYDEHEIRRVVELAVELARTRRGKVTSIDKANVLHSMRVWREVASEVAAENPDVEFEHQLVDSAAMRLVVEPSGFDVLVCGNMFGDILSDEGAVLTGSLGVLPSASLGAGSVGLYEPIHGSAPDLAGTGRANPVGTVLSAALLLRHSLGLEAEARAVEAAVQEAVSQGVGTPDLFGERGVDTRTVTEHLVDHLLREHPHEEPRPRALR